MDIRSLAESPEEVSAFVTGIWRDDYAGRMVVPLWSPDYIDWQLMSSGSGRRHLLGAYMDGKLAGVLMGAPQRFLIDGERHLGLQSSWLTIAPAHRGSGVVRMLKEEQAKRVRDDGGELILSYRYHGTRHSLADRPAAMADADTGTAIRRVGLWVRLLDPPRALRWQSRWLDRLLTRTGSLVLRRLQADDPRIVVREVAEDDLEACLELMSTASASAELAVDWDRDSLRHHLMGGNVGRGLVGCRGEQFVALISFHLIPFLDRCEEPLAVIDLLCIDRLSHSERRAFLLAALSQMKEAGAVLALKMGLGDLQHFAMLDAGFVPRSRDSLQVLNWLTPAAKMSPHGKHLVLWR